MNYSAHYNYLIARARARVLSGYRERHHIVPRCMRGTDDPDNLVYLTAEEHYVAHQLLVKMFPLQTGLAYAAMKMAMKASGRRAYGWLRRKSAAAMLGHTFNNGRPKSVEWRANMSVIQRGRKKSEQELANMSAAKRGKPLPETTHAKAREANIGNTYRRGAVLSDETKLKISIAQRGVKKPPRSAEHCARISASKRGGTLSAETREKIGAALRGKKHSEDHVRKQAAAQRANNAVNRDRRGSVA